MMTLQINKCPEHPEFLSISIDDEGGGTRIAGSKCCGRWVTVRKWSITEQMAEEAIELFHAAKEAAVTAT